MIRYDRVPSKELIKLFEDGNFLACLKVPLTPINQKDLAVFDVQFREKNAVMIYCGTTRLVEIKLKRDGFSVTASKTYTEQNCSKKLMGDWNSKEDNPEDFCKALR
jgi:hypothetical protein